jgi:ribosomal protein S18 acetylase RimI-like enzyme
VAEQWPNLGLASALQSRFMVREQSEWNKGLPMNPADGTGPGSKAWFRSGLEMAGAIAQQCAAFMNRAAGNLPPQLQPSLALRPERPEDESFLYAVYASTREEELTLTNWDAPMRRAFLDHQFNAMRQGYRSMFPDGEFLIVEIDGRPVGRLVVHRAAAEIRVVDLALLPAHQNQGIGTFLMRQICDQADRPVRLSVLKHNRAFLWYERMGFAKAGDLGVYDELEWRPSVKPASPAG